MSQISVALTSLLIASTAFSAPGSDSGTQTKTDGSVPAAPPGWVVVEKDWWYPLRLDAVDALSNAREYYRRNNERAAANEIRRAASWLTYASDQALPETKEALLGARTNLLTLADDLDTDKVAGAARLDDALARASSALAQWHYYRAREEFGRHDSAAAAQDLEAAAGHLENAARSAHFQYGPDTITVFEDIYKDGKMISEGKTIDNDMLGKHLDGIESAVQTMAGALN
jgi:hypothetical protein